MRSARKWIADRGGSAAHARNRTGGMIYLAQGEVAPFAPLTVKRLIDAGLLERRGGRIYLT